MIDFLRELFGTPEAQRDAYGWAAVLLAHTALGALLTAMLAVFGCRRAATIVAVAYALIWEGGQIVLASSSPWDSLADTVAVTLGALLAGALWTRSRLMVFGAVIAIAATLAAGITRRRNR